MTALDLISEQLGYRPPGAPEPARGGCIHRSWCWGEWFIKTNEAPAAANFAAEAAGLRALAATGSIRVPAVIRHGTVGPTAFLVLERLDLSPRGDESILAEHLAALIHGDLWAGNAGFLSHGTPVVFDPAVHYADPECDLAMAALFGGFSSDFESAYRSARPAPDDLGTRRQLYQLYHLLNHALLFGGAYVAQAAHQIRQLA